jgi:glycosyltransferase involved in cell wall biosynthesis
MGKSPAAPEFADFGYRTPKLRSRIVVDVAAMAHGKPAGAGQVKFISVAIPTCNRPDDVERCLASLARVRYLPWELILVDQSDGDETCSAAAAWGARLPSLVYLRLKEKNASAARNLAIERATGEILAFLDDDCTVDPDWLDRVSEAFAEEKDASLIFGSVIAAEHDPVATFVLVSDVRHPKRLHGVLDAIKMRGIGASMYLRLGPTVPASFDLLLGPGARFRGAQDRDYAFRLLVAGRSLVETPRIVVTHHGARSYVGGAASLKLRDYVYGCAACHAKLLRCGAWNFALPIIVVDLAVMLVSIRPHNILRGRPTNLARIVMYLRGLRDGFRTPVDRIRGTFR